MLSFRSFSISYNKRNTRKFSKKVDESPLRMQIKEQKKVDENLKRKSEFVIPFLTGDFSATSEEIAAGRWLFSQPVSMEKMVSKQADLFTSEISEVTLCIF